MAIQAISNTSGVHIYTCLSTDTKPIADANSTLIETDTGTVRKQNTGAPTTWVNSTGSTFVTTSTMVDGSAGNVLTYSGTITWTGTTAPSGSLTQQYWYHQIGKTVFFEISLRYATAGAACTQISLTLPSAMPAPLEWGGNGAANEKLYNGFGYVDSALTGIGPATRVVMGVNSTDTGYIISAVVASLAPRVVNLNIIYRTA